MEAIATIIVLIPLILNFYFMILDKFYPKQLPFLLYILVIQPRCNLDPIEQTLNETPASKETQVDIKDVRINRDELMLAMETVGQSPNKEGDQSLKDCMGYEEFNALFQESEPSLDEVKEAFYVFDQNKDGLVDARDLQRILTYIGLRESTNLDACERMIAQHDRNGDGYVDLIDFSRLLEMCLLEKVD